MPRPIALASVTCILGLLGPEPARADEPPASLVFTSSDFPDLARGFTVPRAGAYSVKVWVAGGSDWTVKAERQAITSAPSRASVRMKGAKATSLPIQAIVSESERVSIRPCPWMAMPPAVRALPSAARFLVGQAASSLNGDAAPLSRSFARRPMSATLVRAPQAVRASVDPFHPETGALAALTRRVKENFDPKRVLNPGRMWAGV